ncbi:4Fe-4S dicluster domain-containing protein [Thermodesulfobacteriota bacterium]
MIKEKLAMVVDSTSCIDCKGCMAACKVENHVPDGYWRNWIKTQEAVLNPEDSGVRVNSHFQPGNCMHCDNPTCVEACPTGATYRNETDGTIQVNKQLCIGCGSCIPACPYGARYRHPEKKVVDKCDFCKTRRERGELPACVITCPTKARVFGNLNDPRSEAAKLLGKGTAVRVVNAKTDTKPNIYYLGITQPLDWPVEAYIPAPIWAWEKLAKPLVWLAVGVNALGVLTMLGKQLLLPEKDDDSGDQ